jgi:hypothetical protein
MPAIKSHLGGLARKIRDPTRQSLPEGFPFDPRGFLAPLAGGGFSEFLPLFG